MNQFIRKYQQNFTEIYSSLPLPERELTIVFINNEPINWKRAKIEIEGETDLGEQILKRLIDLNILKVVP